MTCWTDVLLSAATAWPVIWLMDLARYLIAVAWMLAVLDMASGGWLRHRWVRIRSLVDGQQRREFAQSMGTVLVFSLVGTLVFAGHQLGLLRLYTAPGDYGWTWLPASWVVLVVLHDAWFYWTHRLLHHATVFRRSHRTHHLSIAPTPWTAYSFSIGEAFIQALYLPLVLLVVPAHPSVIFAWTAWMVIRNVMGHSGVELLPRRWLAGWWGRWLTTTLHHELHHAHGHANYGLYFTWWDRWCGTEHPQYREQLAELVERLRRAEPGSAPEVQTAPPTTQEAA